MKKPQAVIFDVDGTLLDTESVHFDAWKEIGRRYGYEVPDETILATRGLTKQKSRSIFKAALGEAFPYDETIDERHTLEEEIIRERSPLLKPGVLQLLEWLRGQGIPMAVASSTRIEATGAHLVWSGIDGYFSACVGGDMVSNSKPAPDIFLRAAELLGAAPEHCLVIEDAPHGVVAAHRAGMDCIVVPDLVQPNAESAGLAVQLESLERVAEYLEENKETEA